MRASTSGPWVLTLTLLRAQACDDFKAAAKDGMGVVAVAFEAVAAVAGATACEPTAANAEEAIANAHYNQG